MGASAAPDRRFSRALSVLLVLAVLGLLLAIAGGAVRDVLRRPADSAVALPEQEEIPERESTVDRPWLPFAERFPPHVVCPHAPADCVAWAYTYETPKTEWETPVIAIPEVDLVVTRDAHHLRALDLHDGQLRWETPWDSSPGRDSTWWMIPYPELDLLLVTRDDEWHGVRLRTGAPLWEDIDNWMESWASGPHLRMLRWEGPLVTLDPDTGAVLGVQPVTAAYGDASGEAILADGALSYRDHGEAIARWEVAVPTSEGVFEHDWPNLWLYPDEVGVWTGERTRSFSRHDGAEIPLAAEDDFDDGPDRSLLVRWQYGELQLEVWWLPSGLQEVVAQRPGEPAVTIPLRRTRQFCCLVDDKLVLWQVTETQVVIDAIGFDDAMQVEEVSSRLDGHDYTIAELATGRDTWVYSFGSDHRALAAVGSSGAAAVSLPDGAMLWESNRRLEPVFQGGGLGWQGEIFAWRGGFLRLIPPLDDSDPR